MVLVSVVRTREASDLLKILGKIKLTTPACRNTVNKKHLQFAEDWTSCQAEGDSSKMKVCALQGESRLDLRLHMRSKDLVPKSCFHTPREEYVILGRTRKFASFADPQDFYDNVKNHWLFEVLEPHIEKTLGAETDSSVDTRAMSTSMFIAHVKNIWPTLQHLRTSILRSAVPGAMCEEISKQDAEFQSTFVDRAPKPPPTTTTTIFQEPPECESRDGYTVEVSGQECIYAPAPCAILGATGSGLECQCVPKLKGTIEWNGRYPRGECIAEIAHLFEEDDKRWKNKDKDIKCCVSSHRKPTEIQDMSVEELPHARSMGHRTGCGKMFGDTYHNGLGSHFDEATCPVAVAKIMDTTGMDLDEILSLLPASRGFQQQVLNAVEMPLI